MNFALEAWRLVSGRKAGVLATMSTRHPGWPYPAMMPYALNSAGRPLFPISTLAAHTQDLLADPRAALMGLVSPIPPEERLAARTAYVQKFPEAEMWADFGDFEFYSLEPMDIHYVGGFGAAGWISAADYFSAFGTNPSD